LQAGRTGRAVDENSERHDNLDRRSRAKRRSAPRARE
jgi:hypothetical protein